MCWCASRVVALSASAHFAAGSSHERCAGCSLTLFDRAHSSVISVLCRALCYDGATARSTVQASTAPGKRVPVTVFVDTCSPVYSGNNVNSADGDMSLDVDMEAPGSPGHAAADNGTADDAITPSLARPASKQSNGAHKNGAVGGAVSSAPKRERDSTDGSASATQPKQKQKKKAKVEKPVEVRVRSCFVFSKWLSVPCW